MNRPESVDSSPRPALAPHAYDNAMIGHLTAAFKRRCAGVSYEWTLLHTCECDHTDTTSTHLQLLGPRPPVLLNVYLQITNIELAENLSKSLKTV